jgi:hypothetical protein
LDDNDLKQIPLVALFAALAILFPQFFHLLGLGPAFLPMFLPVMTGSMFLSSRYVLVLAILSPLISWLLTSMPPIAPPILPVLTAELIVSGLLISILRRHSNLTVIPILIAAIVADRLMLLLLISIIAPILDISDPFFTLALLIAGIPGIILQLIVVPATVYLIEKKYPHWKVK